MFLQHDTGSFLKELLYQVLHIEDVLVQRCPSEVVGHLTLACEDIQETAVGCTCSEVTSVYWQYKESGRILSKLLNPGWTERKRSFVGIRRKRKEKYIWLLSFAFSVPCFCCLLTVSLFISTSNRGWAAKGGKDETRTHPCEVLIPDFHTMLNCLDSYWTIQSCFSKPFGLSVQVILYTFSKN